MFNLYRFRGRTKRSNHRIRPDRPRRQGILSGNESGAVTGIPGTGGEILSGISFNTATNILTINVGWGTENSFTDLTGAATLARIHGPADQNSSAGAILDFNSTAGFSFVKGNNMIGSITGSANVSAFTPANLLAGNWYINVHAAANGGGEIRGNLVPVSAVPEPSTYAFLAGRGALGLVGTRRRRPVA